MVYNCCFIAIKRETGMREQQKVGVKVSDD